MLPKTNFLHIARKVLDKMMHPRLTAATVSAGDLFPQQHGFRSGKSARKLLVSGFVTGRSGYLSIGLCYAYIHKCFICRFVIGNSLVFT